MEYKTIIRNTKSGLKGELIEYLETGAKVRVNGNMRVWRNYQVIKDELAESIQQDTEIPQVELPDEPVQDSTPNMVVLNVERKRDAKNPEADKIEDIKFFRYFYLPFVMYEVFWDYADTIYNMAAQMKLCECKKLGRTIKQIRQEYDWMRRKYLDNTHCEHEQNHMEIFQEICGEEIGTELKLIKWKIRHENLNFTKQQVEFYSFVFLTLALWKAVVMYSAVCDKEIEQIWQQRRRTIIPIQVAKAAKLIPEYLGDRAQDLSAEDIQSSANRIYKLISEVNFVGEFQE